MNLKEMSALTVNFIFVLISAVLGGIAWVINDDIWRTFVLVALFNLAMFVIILFRPEIVSLVNRWRKK